MPVAPGKQGFFGLPDTVAEIPAPGHTADELPQAPGEEDGYWMSAPLDGALVVLGVANHQKTREEEIRLALEDAAQKIAYFHGVRVKVYTMLDTRSGFDDFSYNSHAEFLCDEDGAGYLESLQYNENTDIQVFDNSLMLRVAYKPANAPPINYTTVFSNGKPAWVNKPPQEIAGCLVGVGHAVMQSRIKDAIGLSYQNAMSAIAARIQTRIVAGAADAAGAGAAAGSYQIIEGALTGLMVLEIWKDPDTNGIWTLAVGKSK
jgi:hypothetical protein